MIKENVSQILSKLPPGVELVAAAKTRTPQEIQEAVNAGIIIIGENYVQEAEEAFGVVGNKAKWHFIGHLQTNKVKKAVQIFDVIETVDSLRLAKEIDKRSAVIGKVMSVLIEINSGKEQQKTGVLPETAEELIRQIAALKNVKIIGLMTMGPFSENPEDSRPYFVVTKQLFDKMKSLNIPNVEMKYLSMGMSSSYGVAIEEGANLVRIGTKIFGERSQK
ncbi:MAG: YggS family pyridoxal phosphate-dependent enzyme [Candidatus Margulisbacteria bacterium]|nr:YggS family pyridoxal phosphate-dependent enzyme [Candidatus Margulisiibacteriota bacterium]MBU1021062.1 YggS family pyridoxal phosphate-dependent enzyme [Candidatus Margulisiibacteriota bacterium]MBU1729737.1 YggS family pyridoxal phosphate-dependent enzyme [Candidatus Margulisiibacteriota bacterium]MBU1956002.1 YggS family pyridoxal phosphate-dependent enzyme [Candidatus Margulisiibacteriota bacterium]